MRDAVAGGWSLDGFAAFADSDRLGRLPTISDQTMHAWLAQTKPYTVVLLHATEKRPNPRRTR